MKYEVDDLVHLPDGRTGRVLAETGGPDYYTVRVDGLETGPWYQGDLTKLEDAGPEGSDVDLTQEPPKTEEKASRCRGKKRKNKGGGVDDAGGASAGSDVQHGAGADDQSGEGESATEVKEREQAETAMESQMQTEMQEQQPKQDAKQ